MFILLIIAGIRSAKSETAALSDEKSWRFKLSVEKIIFSPASLKTSCASLAIIAIKKASLKSKVNDHLLIIIII